MSDLDPQRALSTARTHPPGTTLPGATCGSDDIRFRIHPPLFSASDFSLAAEYIYSTHRVAQQYAMAVYRAHSPRFSP